MAKAHFLALLILVNLIVPYSIALKINVKTSSLLQKDSHDSEKSDPSCMANSTSSSVPSCSLKLEDLTTGRFVAGSTSRSHLMPTWINLTLAREGQKFARGYKINIGFSHIFGLISGAAPELVNVLVFTEKSNTPDKAVMRYMATIAQVLLWYDNLLKEDEEDNVILTSLENVRVRHIISAQKAGDQGTLIKPGLCDDNGTLDEGLFADFKKDLEESPIPSRFRNYPASYLKEDKPLPISQFGQALTQFAFVGFPVIYPDRLLINATDDELFAFNHLWAVIGYALGIDDRYNIALQPDIKHVKEYYQKIMENYWIPNIFNIVRHKCAKFISDSLLKAFEKIVPILSPRILLMKLLTDILKVEVPNMKANMSAEDQLKGIALQDQYLPLLQTPTLRAVVNELATNYFQAVGTKYYGANYTTEKSKAENVYYSL